MFFVVGIIVWDSFVLLVNIIVNARFAIRQCYSTSSYCSFWPIIFTYYFYFILCVFNVNFNIIFNAALMRIYINLRSIRYREKKIMFNFYNIWTIVKFIFLIIQGLAITKKKKHSWKIIYSYHFFNLMCTLYVCKCRCIKIFNKLFFVCFLVAVHDLVVIKMCTFCI